MNFEERLKELKASYDGLINRKNVPVLPDNGIVTRYEHPIITAAHIPLEWRYDFSPERNPYLQERIGVNAAFNAGAIYLNGKYVIAVRIEGTDRKSYFAIAESPNGIDGFRFRSRPITMPEYGEPATNIYDMRITAHEDGWIYGIFCVERKDPKAHEDDLSSAVACAGIARTKDLDNWERLPDLVSRTQQRNVVLHPEFFDGKYALYTRPQDGFIETGSGGGICWTLVDDITHAKAKKETVIDPRLYHTIKEAKNGEGPAPIRTSRGWLHLAHGVRNCAAGLRYVLYLYMTALDKPWEVIAEPAGYFLAPRGEERVGDVSNVLFCNGWICDPEKPGTAEADRNIRIYYGSCDTRMHIATSTVGRLLDYCFNAPSDGLHTGSSVENINRLISANQGL
ncbi:MAG: glycosidase [Bacteroidales bacterium]|jgi:4-O-beta-D-mannosyl-D-glucose phosphorylase|nr:glycosidase [Bacteroidales bacterium]MCI2122308.1 glycosidase [Bacteroidales bacterium]MCI2145155.1 glycosidase [Bacteroidales bacterium]